MLILAILLSQLSLLAESFNNQPAYKIWTDTFLDEKMELEGQLRPYMCNYRICILWFTFLKD